MPKSEYLEPTVADLSIERKVRKVKAKLDKAVQMIVNRQERLHSISHVWTSNGLLRDGAVEDWRECRWASCRNTRLVVDDLLSEEEDHG